MKQVHIDLPFPLYITMNHCNAHVPSAFAI